MSTKPTAIKEEVDVDMDPALAEWFRIDKNSPQDEDTKSDEDSVTDEDSDNADVARDAEGVKEEDDLDEWFSVKKEPMIMKTITSEASGSMVCSSFLAFSLMTVSHRTITSTSRWGKVKRLWNMTKNSFSNICSSISNIYRSPPLTHCAWIQKMFLSRLS